MTLFSLNSNLYGDATWTGSEDKVFSNANNWTADPLGANLYIGNDAADLTLGTSMSIGSMYMGNGSTSANSSLTINNGGSLTGETMYIGQDATSTVTVGTGASITSSGDMLVGYNTGANGAIQLTGGTITSSSTLVIGGENKQNSGNKGTGTIRITGGTFSVNACQVGNYGSGTLEISNDGKFESNGNIRIANWGGTSSVTISNTGKLYCYNGGVYVGERGTQTGTLKMNDSSYLETAVLSVGSTENGSGTMTIKDNSSVKITGTSASSAPASYIGAKAGESVLNVYNNASFELSPVKDNNGNVVKKTGNLYIGTNGKGVINQYGGSIYVECSGSLYMADQSTGVGEINITGGTFTAKPGGSGFVLGTRGSATINLSQQGVLTSESEVRLAPGYHANSSSTINQTGGIFNAEAGITYGHNAANTGKGVYNLSGGTLNTTTITYGAKTPNSALFEISGTGVANISGALAVPTNVKGGTLTANSIAIPANGTLAVSGGTVNLGEDGITAAGAYTFNLSGGTFSTKEASWETSLNATVAANSKITFAPEANQTITWEGAMTGNGDILKTGEGRLKINYDNDNTEDIKFDVDNFTVSSGPVDIKGYMYCNLSVEGPDAVFSPGNSVGDAVFGGGFILKEGATLLIEQDASGIDTLSASSFNIDSNSIIDIVADSLNPGAEYPIIINSSGDFSGDLQNDNYWNGLLTPDSSYYWNLSVRGDTVYASVDANAVPEPSTWALLLLGAAGLLYVRKRTQK